MILEICTPSLQSAINAQKGGAQRIELCCNLEFGGLTPSAATIKLARKALSIKVFVLIRPRIGDFNYSDIEFEQMKENIRFCKEVGVDGVVFGILDAQNNIDKERNSQLIELAKPMQTTFHRAFDCLNKPLDDLETLIELGFDRILTSGLEKTAVQGQQLIKELVWKANNRIAILPGSGLSSKNLASFLSFSRAKEAHASAKKVIHQKKESLFAANYFETDVEEVQQLAAIMKQFN
jgi:copper homeostasis protein